MQIHEITRRNKQLEEGLLDTVKDKIAAASGAVVKGMEKYDSAVDSVKNKISNNPVSRAGKEIAGAVGSGMDKIRDQERKREAAKRDAYLKAETEKFAAKLAKEWMASAPKMQQPAEKEQPEDQAQSNVTKPIEPVKTQQDLIAAQNRQMSPASGIKEAKASQRRKQARKNNAQAPKAPVAPAAPATPQEQYQDNFLKWASSKLKTRVGNQDITLDQVKENPGMDEALDAVMATLDNPTANQQAVKKYLFTAVQGIQAIAKEIRKNNPDISSGEQSEANSATTIPQKGQMFMIDKKISGNQLYFKAPNGKWYQNFGSNDAELSVTHPVSKSSAIDKLETMARQGGKMVNVKPDIVDGNKFKVTR